MKIFKSEQVKDIDSYTIQNEPIASIDLMERAASTVTEWLITKYPPTQKFAFFIGPGNNGGDGLAVARQLAQVNYDHVYVFIIKISEKLSKDAEINLQQLVDQGKTHIDTIQPGDSFPELFENEIIIDALFGSGLTRKLSGFVSDVVKFINRSGHDVIAIDIPSGLFGEDNSENDPEAIIKAKYTLSLQFPNLSFFFAENDPFVGEYDVLPIGLHPEIIANTETPFKTISRNEIRTQLIHRSKFSHKGTFGHSLLISGSYGKMGAAILASKACIRSGCGLVTTHVPKSGYDIIQTAVPEAMISIDWSEIMFTHIPDLSLYNAIGIGPGLGTKPNSQKGLVELLDKINSPIVIDADGLNILSENQDALIKLPPGSILTPHPKEFERLVGSSLDHFERMNLQIEFAKKYQIYLVLKGANTSIACPDGKLYINTTGNPGMATAGSGDVLTGIILSLLGQSYLPKWAAIIGVYIHGLAGDLAIEKESQESLIATDIISNLGKAFQQIKNE